MAKEKKSRSELWVEALDNPLRRRVVALLWDEQSGTLSPGAMADMMEMPPATVSYHVGCLRASGAVSLVRIEQVRGTTKHFYELVPAFREQEPVRKLMRASISPEAG